MHVYSKYIQCVFTGIEKKQNRIKITNKFNSHGKFSLNIWRAGTNLYTTGAFYFLNIFWSLISRNKSKKGLKLWDADGHILSIPISVLWVNQMPFFIEESALLYIQYVTHIIALLFIYIELLLIYLVYYIHTVCLIIKDTLITGYICGLYIYNKILGLVSITRSYNRIRRLKQIKKLEIIWSRLLFKCLLSMLSHHLI